jgi:hypothetical protein
MPPIITTRIIPTDSFEFAGHELTLAAGSEAKQTSSQILHSRNDVFEQETAEKTEALA